MFKKYGSIGGVINMTSSSVKRSTGVSGGWGKGCPPRSSIRCVWLKGNNPYASSRQAGNLFVIQIGIGPHASIWYRRHGIRFGAAAAAVATSYSGVGGSRRKGRRASRSVSRRRWWWGVTGAREGMLLGWITIGSSECCSVRVFAWRCTTQRVSVPTRPRRVITAVVVLSWTWWRAVRACLVATTVTRTDCGASPTHGPPPVNVSWCVDDAQVIIIIFFFRFVSQNSLRTINLLFEHCTCSLQPMLGEQERVLRVNWSVSYSSGRFGLNGEVDLRAALYCL